MNWAFTQSTQSRFTKNEYTNGVLSSVLFEKLNETE